jgi:para-nitrobenzyl esterase
MMKSSVFAALCLTILAANPLWAQAPRARISDGEVSGLREGTISAFLGIPFSAPPTGANRWRAPQPVVPWQGIRQADHFAASCMQLVNPAGLGPWTHEYVVDGPVSEDCLYLNVWTPARAGARLPVLVWIHGGAFTSGSGSVPIYNGAALAEQGIVVVTINYRLGALGFLAHPELTKEAQATHTPPGNYGLQDMLAALRWVRANIGSFGGDPDAITLAGQSAGAMAVHDLIASPLAATLFRRAIAESGLPSIRRNAPLSVAEHDGVTFAHDKGADSLTELRALPANTLLSVGKDGPRFGPIADGVLLPGSSAPGAGQTFNDTPLLIGRNTDESGSFNSTPTPPTTDALTQLLQDSYGKLAPRFGTLYPIGTEAERVSAVRDITRDRGLGALYSYCRDRLAVSRQPMYVYLFDHTEPGPQAQRYGAFHSAEIPYVFNTFDASPERGFTAQDRALEKTLSSYWVAFVRSGDPNGDGRPTWPRMQANDLTVMELGDHPGPRAILPPSTLTLIRDFIAAGGSPSFF